MFDRRSLDGKLFRLLALIVVAILLGGGGRSAPLTNLIVQLTALVVLTFSYTEFRSFLRFTPALLLVLVFATLALPLAHVLPLSPSLWTELPGRDLVLDSLQLIDEAGSWMPLSVDRSLSLLAFTGLIAPFAILLLGLSLKTEWWGIIFSALFGLTIVLMIVGAIQLASGGTLLDFYVGGSSQRLSGTFANHNSTGLFLVLMLTLVVTLGDWIGTGPFSSRVARIAFAIMCMLGIILSQSRSSIAISLLPLIILATRFAPMGRRMRWRSRGGVAAIAVVAAVIVAGAFVFQSSRADQVIDRFSSFEDLRPAIWEDSLVSADRFWPVGSGMGTFDEVFQLDESLEHVTPRRAGRAHNDFLEVAIEAGVVGLVLIAAWFAYLLSLVVRRARGGMGYRAMGVGASLLCIALQSVVDYPLRNQALLCVAALLIAFLVSGDRGVGREVARG